MRWLAWVVPLLCAACGSATLSAPTPPAPARTAEAERTVAPPGGACDPIDASDPLTVAYLAFLDGEVDRAAERLGTPLCIEELGAPHPFERGADRYIAADVLVRDEGTGDTVEVRSYSMRGGAVRPTFNDLFFSRRVAEEIGLRQLPAWLAERPQMTAFARREPVPGAWLAWLAGAESSTLCLERRRHDPTCWAEAGVVRAVEPYEWEFADGDIEERPFGQLRIERAGGRPVSWSVRLAGSLERALSAWGTPPARARRPAWARLRYDPSTSDPGGPRQWRAVESIEGTRLGPLAALRAEPIAVEDGWSVVVVRGDLHARLCARYAAWTCGDVLEPNPSGSVYRAHQVVDAIPIGPSTFATVRYTHESGGEIPGSAARGDAFLEIHDVVGARLVARGAIAIGDATWTTRTGPDGLSRRAPLERVYHVPRRAEEGCIALGAAETRVGPARPDFAPLEEGAPLNLARAGGAVPFLVDTRPGLTRPRAELEGLWAVTRSGLERVERCTDTATTSLVPPRVPAALAPAPAACLESLAQRIHRRAPLPPLVATTPPCGAIQRRAGQLVARERYRYEAGRRVQTLYASVPSGPRADRTVQRTVDVFRGDRRVGRQSESMQLSGEEEDCGSTSQVRYALDRRGRPSRATVRVDNCEGVDPGPHVERYRWTAGDGFETSSDGRHRADERRTYLPSYAAPVAQVRCSLGCSCEAEVSDAEGHLRERIRSSDPTDVWEYVYDCDGPSWGALDGHELDP